MDQQLRQTWDLESIFPGGSQSPVLTEHLQNLEHVLEGLKEQVSALPDGTAAAGVRDRWHEVLERFQAAVEGLGQGSSFVGCLMAQDVKDRQARLLYGQTSQLYAQLSSLMTLLDARLLALSDQALEALLADERMAPLAFNLRERRTVARHKMAPEREMLAADLSVDGYHAWGVMYDTVVGRMTIKLEHDGKVEELSVGQAANKFSEPDRAMRQKLFDKWEEAWGNEAELCAAALNHLSGYRLALYRHRGWDSILKEPLTMNRMTEATLNAMWEAVGTAKDGLARYYARKAKLLGHDQTNWHDLYAPLAQVTRKIPYEEAAAFIIGHFGRFSPGMAEFAERAFKQAWIEVEDRPAKAPGGFCTSLPLSKESRIFMTYSGDTDGVRTLAHELGHAYHSHVMMDLPPLTQDYAMNVAETASTFAELLINAAAIANATSKEEKLALLDSKISDSAAYLMNIHARYIFETRFYDARRKGMVSIERLNSLMEEAQKEAYHGALGVYHPHFWASKGHFYGTDQPFYNFPYTFGYLFSAGIYARALQEGPAFEQKYVELLRDTGRMMVEDLAARHLGVDLTRPDFWLTGVNQALADVEEFLHLTE
ncbi:MAG TPA: M3 family oligoendopeptidase [Symbiobacteriaceae bacterium]|nr:M3 family oligoendopeptidase [Symbiobacteriaceae bacterium]